MIYTGLLLCSSVLAESPALAPESLVIVANRVARSMLKADWSSFRRDATNELLIEERWTAYDQYFVKDHKGKKGILGPAGFRLVGYVSPLSNSVNLSKNESALFRAYCKIVGESRAYSGPKWSWPEISERDRVFPLDHGYAQGPCVVGKVASNMEWCVEFVNLDGKWKARKLILAGH